MASEEKFMTTMMGNDDDTGDGGDEDNANK